MLLSVLAIWKRPPMARSIWIDSTARAIASSKRSSTNMAKASEFFARASWRRAPHRAEDGDGLGVGLDRLAHAAHVAEEHALGAEHLGAERGGRLRVQRCGLHSRAPARRRRGRPARRRARARISLRSASASTSSAGSSRRGRPRRRAGRPAGRARGGPRRGRGAPCGRARAHAARACPLSREPAERGEVAPLAPPAEMR